MAATAKRRCSQLQPLQPHKVRASMIDRRQRREIGILDMAGPSLDASSAVTRPCGRWTPRGRGREGKGKCNTAAGRRWLLGGCDLRVDQDVEAPQDRRGLAEQVRRRRVAQYAPVRPIERHLLARARKGPHSRARCDGGMRRGCRRRAHGVHGSLLTSAARGGSRRRW